MQSWTPNYIHDCALVQVPGSRQDDHELPFGGVYIASVVDHLVTKVFRRHNSARSCQANLEVGSQTRITWGRLVLQTPLYFLS